MNIYFECKIRYDKFQENGTLKKVNESYLVDAVSFTDAEASVIDNIASFISGEYVITSIRKTKIAELFINADDKRYYLIKCAFISFNEKNGKEKRSISQILVSADSPDEAIGKFEANMKNTLSDYEVIAIYDTAYLDVYSRQVN